MRKASQDTDTAEQGRVKVEGSGTMQAQKRPQETKPKVTWIFISAPHFEASLCEVYPYDGTPFHSGLLLLFA